MSPEDNTTRATEIALADEFRSAIDDARERVHAVLEPACPTPAFLQALREEVQRAMTTPDAVPYPELADADAYWDATVKPQSRSVRTAVEEIVSWLEQRIITTMEVAETDLKSLVDAAAADPGDDPTALRVLIAEEVGSRCLDLHHQMAEVLSVLPTSDTLDEARRHGDEAMRAQATADVESLKAAYLRDAGGDDAHQRFAEGQWSETFAERVNHRCSMLAGQPPWRHQEFALVGYERARSEAERIVEESAVRLQAPLRGLQELLLERYDAGVSADA
ncbi:MAG: hypothetical protein R8F63_11820 [Acidimicrobiales bacterium]|nr:hypothetical protein [Acidimicrobiales bacterium]